VINLNIEEVQNKLGLPIKRNSTSLGLDVASRTGWCVIKSTSKTLDIDYGFIKIDSKDIYFKFSRFLQSMNDIIKKEYRVIIEDSFLGHLNPWTMKTLSKMEGIAYAIALQKEVEYVEFIMASSARKRVGVKGTCKKKEVYEWLKDTLNIDVQDEDAADAVILALYGVIIQPITKV
jgi:Holliday junction resolvasome RuvABC endonuclease subunit